MTDAGTPPRPVSAQLGKAAGWNRPITEPLPKFRQFADKTNNSKTAVNDGAASPRAQTIPKEARGKVRRGFAGALDGHIGFDWAAFARKLPTARDPESTAARKKLFNQFDANRNGLLSVAEVDMAVRGVLKSPALFHSKPVVMRAYQAARRANGARSGRKGDFVERNEFRLLLACVPRARAHASTPPRLPTRVG